MCVLTSCLYLLTMVHKLPPNYHCRVLLKGFYFLIIYILSLEASREKKKNNRRGRLQIWEGIYRGFYICINKSLWGKPLISFVAAGRMLERAFSVSCVKCFCTLFCGWSSERCGNESAGEASSNCTSGPLEIGCCLAASARSVIAGGGGFSR